MVILWISMCLQSLMKFHPCLFKILRKNQNVADKELQRAITLNKIGPRPNFCIINVHLWISMWSQNLMKFHHCLLKMLRKNQNASDKKLQKAITLKELAPSPYFSIMKFSHCLFKILNNQNIADTQMDGGTTWKQYTSHTHSLQGV